MANFGKETDSNKNELNKLSKKVKAILKKGSIKDFIKNLVFLMEQHVFPQDYYKII